MENVVFVNDVEFFLFAVKGDVERDLWLVGFDFDEGFGAVGLFSRDQLGVHFGAESFVANGD